MNLRDPSAFSPPRPASGRGGRGVRGSVLTCTPPVQLFVYASVTQLGIAVQNPSPPTPLPEYRARGARSKDVGLIAKSSEGGLKSKALSVSDAVRNLYQHQSPRFERGCLGGKGASPAASKSALMNRGHCASFGRNERAKVVLPAPFGPAIMIIFLLMLALLPGIGRAAATALSHAKTRRRKEEKVLVAFSSYLCVLAS